MPQTVPAHAATGFLILLFTGAWILRRHSDWLPATVVVTTPVEISKLLFAYMPPVLSAVYIGSIHRGAILDASRFFIGLSLVYALFAHRRGFRGREWGPSYALALATLALWAVSLTYTSNTVLLIQELIRGMTLLTFSASVAVLLAEKPGATDAVWWAFVVAGGLMALVGVAQFYAGFYFWIPELALTHGGVRRVNGMQSDPNFYGEYLVIWAAFTLAMALTVERNRARWGLAFVFAVEWLALLFSYSRGAWMAMAVALAAFFTTLLVSRDYSRVRKAIVLCGFALLAAFSVSVVFPLMRAKPDLSNPGALVASPKGPGDVSGPDVLGACFRP